MCFVKNTSIKPAIYIIDSFNHWPIVCVHFVYVAVHPLPVCVCVCGNFFSTLLTLKLFHMEFFLCHCCTAAVIAVTFISVTHIMA